MEENYKARRQYRRERFDPVLGERRKRSILIHQSSWEKLCDLYEKTGKTFYRVIDEALDLYLQRYTWLKNEQEKAAGNEQLPIKLETKELREF
jgi:hypothetical protein